jgi:hypothetical protein
MTRVDAAREVRSARLVREYTDVADAVRADAITPTHVHQLASIARHRSLRFSDDVAMLVDAATRIDPDAYRRVATHWRSLADDLLAPDERDETNTLDIARCYAGTRLLNGTFDAVRGAAPHTLLLERSAPSGEDDTRSAEQRRADALSDILTNGTPVRAISTTWRCYVAITTLVPTKAGNSPATPTTPETQPRRNQPDARCDPCSSNEPHTNRN